MSDTTKIQWADATFNPWEGCTKVSDGCKHCYAEARNNRFSGGANWGPGKPRRRTTSANWLKPVKWNEQPWICDACGTAHAVPGQICMQAGCDCETKHRLRVFPSLCDWLDDEVPIEWLADFLQLIYRTPNLDWLLLTKRPENWINRIAEAMVYLDKEWMAGQANMRSSVGHWLGSWLEGQVAGAFRGLAKNPQNVLLGVSVENQAMADQRIPELLKIPARVRFLSVEPMLEAIDFKKTGDVMKSVMPFYGLTNDVSIHWVIFGGESGSQARPCYQEWIRDGVRQCQSAGIAVFVKQLGQNSMTRDTKERDWRPFKDNKGGDMAEWPNDLRVREFPTKGPK